MRPVIINRRNKVEAEQAIADLIKRGFEVVFPLTEQFSGKKYFDRDDKGVHVFSHTTHDSYWTAKLQKVI